MPLVGWILRESLQRGFRIVARLRGALSRCDTGRSPGLNVADGDDIFPSPDRDLFGERPPAKRRVGRKPHLPSPELQARIRELRQQSNPRLSIVQIAQLVGVSKSTLFRHHADQIGSISKAGIRAHGAAAVERPPRGRPRHRPTPEQRAQVRRELRAGCSLDEIARHLGISVPTLKRRYGDDLVSRPQDPLPRRKVCRD
ncbi:hypothetical protein [Aurantiacibacter hainanensis]|uniref:hypothetical protein n=1 Tax=Aurantiacibacter hainanensis TaxID=3076114 RepID=UPI0030C68028